MIYMDSNVLSFLKENFLTLSFIFLVLKSMFPESRFLKAIGDAFSEKFAAFKK